MGSRLFRGGVPTGPDVARLLEAIPAEPGTSVSHDQVAELIHTQVGSSRFRSVTNAWRNKLFRDRLLQTNSEGGEFRFLTADESLDKGLGGFKRVGRAAGRLRVRVDAVNPSDLTTPEKQGRHVLLRRAAQAVGDEAAKSAKTVAGPAPIQTTRRIAN